MLFRSFFSMTSAVVLLVIFAIGSGAATIIESYYDTKSAWAAVYGASWFALVQVLLGINLVYNIFRYNLFRNEKLPVSVFFVGAAAAACPARWGRENSACRYGRHILCLPNQRFSTNSHHFYGIIFFTMKPQELKPKAQSDWQVSCKSGAQCPQGGRLYV